MTAPTRKTLTITIEVTEGDEPNKLIYAVKTDGLAGREENLLHVLDAVTAELRKSV